MIWFVRDDNDKITYLTPDGKSFNNIKDTKDHISFNIDKLIKMSETFKLKMDRLSKIKKIIKNF